mmetsp:Transcript_12807/g.34933  ORF Transcript_12807/g.34933 Transcript_12807/m.34933 type:complete len:377 (+) Transcript_12807:51-1181(+)
MQCKPGSVSVGRGKAAFAGPHRMPNLNSQFSQVQVQQFPAPAHLCPGYVVNTTSEHSFVDPRSSGRDVANLDAAPCSRRCLLLTASMAGLLLSQGQSASANVLPNLTGVNSMELEDAAFEAYANRDFQEAVNLLTQLVNKEQSSPRWLEMRAQVLCDGKNFDVAIQDFNAALGLTPEIDEIGRARLLAGRALAEEGLGLWEDAKTDYTVALDLASQGGSSPDPYVVNSRGNCFNSLGMWKEAREDYLTSSQLFQQAKGYKGPNGSSTARLDGAIYSASNAALMLAQMGDLKGAMKEMERIARRAPGSVDMRAALASLYWADGRTALAEEEWEFACTKINTGCAKYTDPDWLGRIRRWPPVMVSKMQDFVQIRASTS